MGEKSKLFTVNALDWIKSAVVAGLTAGASLLVSSFESGALPTIIQVKTAGTASGCAGAAYLIKNLLTNSKDELLKKE